MAMAMAMVIVMVIVMVTVRAVREVDCNGDVVIMDALEVSCGVG